MKFPHTEKFIKSLEKQKEGFFYSLNPNGQGRELKEGKNPSIVRLVVKRLSDFRQIANRYPAQTEEFLTIVEQGESISEIIRLKTPILVILFALNTQKNMKFIEN
jgi:hypothetical protein